jgi:PAS domain S-box-containing protein
MTTILENTEADIWTPERQLFKAVTESTTLIAWATDIAGMCFYLSPEWYRFTGRDPNAGIGLNWLLAIHPEDRETVRRAFFKAHDGRTTYGVAYRLGRPDGSYSLVWAVGLPKFGANEVFEGLFGTVFPIEGEQRLHLGEHNVSETTRCLTDREREVLQLIAEGNTSEEAAVILGITRRTVETHIANAGLKLGGLNRVHTVVRAVRLNEL